MTEQQSLAQKAEGRGLTFDVIAELSGFSLGRLALIRHNMAASLRCKPAEVPMYDLALFAVACSALELDPLIRQCYWIERQGKAAVQISIDGYRAIADRSGTAAGSSPPTFRGQIEWEHRGRKKIVPEYCQVTVWKIVQGRPCSFTGEARWMEYVPRAVGADKESDMWARMPFNQLAKCAEGQALRKAWPAHTGAAQTHAEQQVMAITQQPRPPRSRAELAEQHAQIFDQAHEWPSAPALQAASPNVDLDTGEVLTDDDDDDLPFDAQVDDDTAVVAADNDDIGAAFGYNRQLLEQARELGAKGLARYVAAAEWKLNAIVEANVALEQIIQQRNGDAAIAQRQEAIL
jgi:phage recombination protein Bet